MGAKRIEGRYVGIVRKLDNLGRVVVPKELRKHLDLKRNDAVEVFGNGKQIILRKYYSCCMFCQSKHNLISYQGVLVCAQCIEGMTARD